MISIPTFKPGQRVRLHYHPYEMTCPKCNDGRIEPDTSFEIETEVLGTTEIGQCSCGYVLDLPEGWYKVKVNDCTLAVPYTLLEPLEDEDDLR
jgi:hypothetical protein